jgi:opacity protein-like surface antigen
MFLPHVRQVNLWPVADQPCGGSDEHSIRGRSINTNGKHVTFKMRTTSLALSPLLLLASVASAQTTPGNWYVETGLGITHANGNYSSQVGASLAPSSNYRFDSASYDHTGTLGGRVAIGWRAASVLAVELAYADFGRHDTRALAIPIQTLTGASTIDGRFRVSAVTLDAVGQLPLPGALSLTARVGVAMTEQRYSQTRTYSNPPGSVAADYPTTRQTRLHWGMGAQYAINPNLAVVANYERIEYVGNDFSSAPIDSGTRAGKFGYGLLSVGVRYSF